MSLYKEPSSAGKKVASKLGEKFTAAREALGLNIEQLAEKTGVPLSALKMWETGPECLRSLPAILGVLNATLHITPGCFSLDSKIAPANRPVFL